MKPTFRTREEPPGMVVHDPIQGRQFPLETPSRVEPSRSDTGRFRFPVDAATTIETERLTLPFVVVTYVRDGDGEFLAEAEHFAYEEFPSGTYVLELMAPIKLSVRVDGALAIASSTDHMRFEFEGSTRVEIGARSNHRRPAATVTTTEEPEDLMAAVSTFGSALKTTSPERSLPSLRGHPPRVLLGDELQIPDGLAPPETDVLIEVPPTRAAVYAATTLAYYLGATVVPASEPRLVTETGFAHSFDPSPQELEEGLERVLKQVFFLECLTRPEGLYEIDLHERDAFDERADLDWASLYDASAAERLETYLSVGYDEIADLVPTWRLATYATSAPSNATLLPFVANGLSLIRTPAVHTTPDVPGQKGLDLAEFVRSADTSSDEPPADASSDETPADVSYVSPPATETLEVAWMGEQRPIGANHLLESGFENKLDRGRLSDEVGITVVCNDPAMSAEYDGASRSLYGNRDELPFDVTVHYDLSTTALESVLETDTDFFHYIGHSEADAFVCHDGRLDASTLDEIGPHTFLLNGCTSYEQGVHLIESGGVGGIVTHSDVGNEDATAIGRLIARLLNVGFSLRAALEVAHDSEIVGTQYVVVGDGGAQVAQNEGGTPIRYRIEPDGDAFELTIHTYPTVEAGMGAVYLPFIDGVESHFLTGGALPSVSLEADELAQFLRLEDVPVVFDGSYCWSSDVELSVR